MRNSLHQILLGYQMKENQMDETCSTNGEMRNAYKIFDGKPEGKRPLRRHRHRWEDNIKIDLREMGLEVWIGFIWFRIVTSGGLLCTW
jgi:hypothetical protein